MSKNPFGNNVFGAMWESVEDNTKERAEECKNIMVRVIHKDTGALADSVQIEQLNGASYLVGINENRLINDPRNAGNVNYAPFYYYGTRAYTIRAKNAKALHWVKNGVNYYAKSVRHPAVGPHNFIQDTLDQMR